MRVTEYPYAGLVLPDETGLNPEPYMGVCQQVLASLDPRPVGVPKISAKRHAVLGHYYGLRVTAQPDSDFGPRILIEVLTRDGAAPDEEMASRLLSDTVLASLDHSHADIIEWYSPDTLLDAEDFIRLRSYVSPRREAAQSDPEDGSASLEHLHDDDDLASRAAQLVETQRLDPCPDQLSTQDLRALISQQDEDATDPYEGDPLGRMKARIAEQEADQMRLSAAGWAMSGVLAVVCFPVAVFVWILSLGRGMDFRLTTQVLSVTALFVALFNSERINLMLHQFLN